MICLKNLMVNGDIAQAYSIGYIHLTKINYLLKVFAFWCYMTFY